jgi:translation initiation factor IF-3
LARKAQTKIEVKEIQLRPKTNVHHRNIKVNVARKWLDKGMKVRATIRFRGREASYPELALEDLREIAEMLKDISTIEVPPAVEGRNMSMVLIPVKPGKKPSPATAKESEKPDTVENQVQKPDAKIKTAETTPAENVDLKVRTSPE